MSCLATHFFIRILKIRSDIDGKYVDRTNIYKGSATYFYQK